MKIKATKLPILLIIAALMFSCEQRKTNAPHMQFPEYVTSKENFKNKISPGDSIAISTEFVTTKLLYKKTNTNKLVMKIFTELNELNEKVLDEKSQAIEKIAITEISNIKNYQVLVISWFAENLNLNYTKEFQIQDY